MILRSTYIKIWAALLGLLILTCGAAYIDLSPFNVAIAMVIALAVLSALLCRLRHKQRD